MFFYFSEGLDAGVFAPEVEFSFFGYAVAADIVARALEHALGAAAVEVWVVVVYYPLSLGLHVVVICGLVVGLDELAGVCDVFPVDVFCYGAQCDDGFVLQEAFVDGGGGVADHGVAHHDVFAYGEGVYPYHAFGL